MSRKLITSLASKPFIGAASMFGKSYAGSGPFFSLTTTRSAHAKVTLEQAQDMPRSYNELPNELIISAAIEGDQDAIEERLLLLDTQAHRLKIIKATEKEGSL